MNSLFNDYFWPIFLEFNIYFRFLLQSIFHFSNQYLHSNLTELDTCGHYFSLTICPFLHLMLLPIWLAYIVLLHIPFHSIHSILLDSRDLFYSTTHSGANRQLTAPLPLLRPARYKSVVSLRTHLRAFSRIWSVRIGSAPCRAAAAHSHWLRIRPNTSSLYVIASPMSTRSCVRRVRRSTSKGCSTPFRTSSPTRVRRRSATRRTWTSSCSATSVSLPTSKSSGALRCVKCSTLLLLPPPPPAELSRPGLPHCNATQRPLFLTSFHSILFYMFWCIQ